MLRKDWVMRMTEQIAQVIAKLLFNKEIHRYEDCHQLTDEALREHFTLSRDLVLALSADDCLGLATGFGTASPELILPLVDLLVADGEACALEGRGDQASLLYEKSLAFLDRLSDSADERLQSLLSAKRALIADRLQPGE